ncbi:hypothetical protein PENCOP_c005G01944 [Penicillium coprophilum]|uniref:Altered inheritance of mitochondria protein 9, mitochondrial n=1 Tax=Penicillium coprophilum TaxID=36646 RepID=A0A1V6URQ5_9EURO|nr:hypothetical protein PENCOP_c005G01944 [Penicillium coprophilum]
MAMAKRSLRKICIDTPGIDGLQVAVGVCDGAQSCIKVTKCTEGLHKKAFILKMDNCCEVFAKLPNPDAGPARFTIASQIATRKLAWSIDAASNPDGAEYIIEEKAPGVRLGSVWSRWPRDLKQQLITQVIDIENTLTGVGFNMHGCIYFKDDLRSLGVKLEEASIQSATTSIPALFAIGPLTTGELWNGVRSGMDLDRGPYLDPQSVNEAASGNVLMHPDLHLDNIFVDPETLQITRIVDWQSAFVALWFYHANVPRICAYREPLPEGWGVPERPEDFDSLSAEEQLKVDNDLERQILHKYYEAQVYKRSPRYWSLLEDKRVPIIRNPAWLVTRVALLPVDGIVDPEDYAYSPEEQPGS